MDINNTPLRQCAIEMENLSKLDKHAIVSYLYINPKNIYELNSLVHSVFMNGYFYAECGHKKLDTLFLKLYNTKVSLIFGGGNNIDTNRLDSLLSSKTIFSDFFNKGISFYNLQKKVK